MFDFLFSRKRKVKLLIACSDGVIEKRKAEVEGNFATIQKTLEAWGLSPYHLFDFQGKATQLVVDDDCNPISLDGHDWILDSLDAVVEEKYEVETQRIQEKSKVKTKAALLLSTSVLVLALTVVVLVITGLIQAGTLKVVMP